MKNMDQLIQTLLEKDSHIKSEQNSNYSLDDIHQLLNYFKKALFPGTFHHMENKDNTNFLQSVLYRLKFKLIAVIIQSNKTKNTAEKITSQILEQLPALKEELNNDINAIFNGDPAATSKIEVIIAYPSFEAIMVHRIAHILIHEGMDLLARACSGIAHRETGIDIHPKATIGNHFCIDHGTGIVIGETAIIGNNVKIYQGVTIGALSVSKKQTNTKRHPTIEDNVTIYAKTTILGGETVIGKNSIIGGNVWITRSVPENSKIMNKGYNIEHSK